MQPEGYEYQTDFVRKLVAERDRNRAEGRAEGQARTILTFLSARGFEVGEEVRQRLLACQDLDQLEEWTRRAATADSLDDLFK